MISSIASCLGKHLAKISADSDISKGKYNDKEIEAILIYQITNFLKTVIWFFLLAISTGIIWSLIGDVRYIYTTSIFFITTLIFRKIFGGYHHDSEIVCIIISTIIPIVGGYLALKFNMKIYIIAVVYLFSYITAFTKKVVDSPEKRFEEGNKVLTLELKERFYKFGIALLVITTILHIFIYFKGFNLASNAITIGLFAIFFNLYFGK